MSSIIEASRSWILITTDYSDASILLLLLLFLTHNWRPLSHREKKKKKRGGKKKGKGLKAKSIDLTSQ